MIEYVSASKLIPLYDDKGFDTLIDLNNKRLYGVFDGIGVNEDSRNCSAVAKELFTELTTKNADFKSMSAIVHAANDTMKDYTQGGTTATVVKIDELNQINYVHVGDSRLYVLTGTRLKQVTADEGHGNVLYNYLGANGRGIFQVGEIEKWDRLLLCTDGITGDWRDQVIPDEKIEEALIYAETPESAIESLVAMSKKKDDKAIVVVFREQT